MPYVSVSQLKPGMKVRCGPDEAYTVASPPEIKTDYEYRDRLGPLYSAKALVVSLVDRVQPFVFEDEDERVFVEDEF